MNIILYQFNGDSRTINKILENPLNISIKLRKDFNILNPELTLLDNNYNFNNYNYAVIPELNRFYFIDLITNLSNSLYKLDLKCDVLETHKNVILNSNARFNRKIKNGDYITINSEISYLKSFSKHMGDVTLSGESDMILTSVGVV